MIQYSSDEDILSINENNIDKSFVKDENLVDPKLLGCDRNLENGSS
jgi:hypothetical protein